MLSQTKNTKTVVPTDPGNEKVAPHDETVQHDAVFGEITEEGPNYRDVRDLLSLSVGY